MKISAKLERTSPLTIPVMGGTGSAPTALAAFDAALHSIGVHNFNLIRLSSVIPPGATLLRHTPGEDPLVDLRATPTGRQPLGGWGDRMYAVWAYESAQLLGEEAWAGVAWVQDPEDGRGLFVEHEGGSEMQVREELAASLTSISRTRQLDHLEQRSVVVGARCVDQPVAALVIAPFMTEPWRNVGSSAT